MFGLPEVLRAIKLLDMPRKIKQFNNKIRKMEENGHVVIVLFVFVLFLSLFIFPK
jgi:hypothetical protein